jgi:diguanylate cyclase (GGDEF)-like protein
MRDNGAFIEATRVFRSPSNIPDGTYVELVQSLFRTLVTTSIIGVTFTGVAGLIASRTPDLVLHALAAAGVLSVIARMLILLLLRKNALDAELQPSAARRLERTFAGAYLAFALALGLFSARSFQVAPADAHVLVVALLVGYAAGVAAGISYRPWIGASAMLVGVTPTIGAALSSPSPTYRAVGLLLAVFLAGGLHSMMARYHLVTGGIARRRLFSSLARTDGLTGISNRLALQEHFQEMIRNLSGAQDVAVHCLDLDHFKPVNDRHGHPAGDQLLRLVAERLSRLLRKDDFVARIGGDEFVILQRLREASEAELLQRRIIRTIAEPCLVGELSLSVGTSVGCALASEHGTDLERLIAAADQALLRAKARGGGVGRMAPPGAVQLLRAS